MHRDEVVLIGKDYWDTLGGNGTYEEILNIAKTRIVCFETKIEQIFITESSVEIFLANNKKEALDSLFFDSVQSFKHANLGGHLFKKSKNGNPGIVLYIKKTSGLFSLLFSFVDLFKDA